MSIFERLSARHVVCVFAPGRQPLPDPFLEWVNRSRGATDWYLATIVLAEIERGISKLRRTGAAAKAERLADWLDVTMQEFGDHILSLDPATALDAGRLADLTNARGSNPGLADILLAATTRTAGLRVLTANVRHFAELDVRYHNPLAGDYPPS